MHPFHQQDEAKAVLDEYKVQAEAWGPFAEGKNGLFSNELLQSIADKHGKSIAQVVLRWLYQRGIVAIPKSVRKERMAENFAILDFELDHIDLALIATLDQRESSFFDHRDPERWSGLARESSKPEHMTVGQQQRYASGCRNLVLAAATVIVGRHAIAFKPPVGNLGTAQEMG